MRIYAVLAAIRWELNGPFSFEETHFILKDARYITHISTRGNTFKNTVVADETKGVERLVCLPSQTCQNTKPTLRKYLGCGTDSFQEARSFRLDGKLDGSQLVKSPISTFYEFCHPFLYTSACQFPWVYVIGIQVAGACYRTLCHQLFLDFGSTIYSRAYALRSLGQ